MSRTLITRASTAIAAAAMLLSVASPAEARRSCKRLNKTEGALIGGAGGAVLGKVVFGSTAGTLATAAAGGVAGHEKNCA